MPKSKKKNSKSNNVAASNRNPRVIKSGVYDGSYSSSDFVVSGHSTGSPYSEMEALSHQVSRDAGVVPDYPTDNNYRLRKTSTDVGYAMPADRRDTADMGGPELYGPNPSMLKQTTLSELNGSRSGRRISLWSGLGLAGATLSGYVAYKLYQQSETSSLSARGEIGTQKSTAIEKTTGTKKATNSRKSAGQESATRY